jgi:hypothetical protein
VSDGGLTGATSESFTISPAAASQLAFHQQPITGGTSNLNVVSTYVEDQYGNLVTDDSSNVTMARASGPGVLTGTLTVAADHGVATFNNLVLSKIGTYTLSASDGSLAAATSNSFTVGARLIFLLQPPVTTVAGVTMSPVTVNIVDANGRPLTTESSAVTLAIASGPAGAALNVTVNAVNGVATFGALALPTAGAYKLLASDGTIKTATSKSFNIVPAAPVQSQLVFTQDATACLAGVKMKPSLSLEFRDQYGNVATNYLGTVTLSVASGPGVLIGNANTTVKKGFATFSNVMLRTAGLYTLHAAVGGLGLDTAGFTVSPNAAKKLMFLQPPTPVAMGADISPAITVEVTDTYGNVITNSTASVTLALAGGPKGGMFKNGTAGVLTSSPVTVVNGVATFSHVALTLAGNYKLKATATKLTPVTSGTLTVS